MPKPKSTTPKIGSTTYASGWKPAKASAKAIADFRDLLVRDTGLDVLTEHKAAPVRVVPTGSIDLDSATGIGGYPVGMITEMWGASDAGKTSQAMIAVGNAQRLFPDQFAGWVDMEQTFDPDWATLLGVDMDRLVLIPNPHTAEDVADITKRMVHRGIFSIVVVDSIGSMISRVEFEKESEDAVVAAVARVVTRLVKMCSAICRSNGTTLLVINQIRANISNYGGPTTRPGGFALTHHSAMRLAVRRGELRTIKIGKDDIPVGHEVVVKVEKNKRAPAGFVARFFLQNQATKDFGPIGIDKAFEAFNIGRDIEFITGSGWYYVPNGTEEPTRLQGKDKVVAHLRANPDLIEQIRTRMLTTDKDLTEIPDEIDQSDEVAAMLEGA